jgi:hypothetical protein
MPDATIMQALKQRLRGVAGGTWRKGGGMATAARKAAEKAARGKHQQ